MKIDLTKKQFQKHYGVIKAVIADTSGVELDFNLVGKVYEVFPIKPIPLSVAEILVAWIKGYIAGRESLATVF